MPGVPTPTLHCNTNYDHLAIKLLIQRKENGEKKIKRTLNCTERLKEPGLFKNGETGVRRTINCRKYASDFSTLSTQTD